jgi:tetratricopeptide (TPR) repeat protein
MLEQIELVEAEKNEISLSMQPRDFIEDQSQQLSSTEYSQILDDYELTLFLNPNFFFGYYNRAFIKLRLGEYKSAIEDLNRAIELEPEFAEAYFNRGLTKIFMDDIDGGALDLSRAGELGITGAYNVIKRYAD